MCIITSTSAMMHRHTAARCVSSENHCPRHNDGARSKLDWKLSEENHLNVELYAIAGYSIVHPMAYLQLRLDSICKVGECEVRMNLFQDRINSFQTRMNIL